MCGRFALVVSKREVEKLFGLKMSEELTPRYNISPGQIAPVVVSEGAGGSKRIRFMRWGLVPSWAKDPSVGNRLINARCETVREKAAFRSSFLRRRALVPISGFYEWKREGKVKQPYYSILKNSRLFSLAGLWEYWERNEGALETFTILTTTPNNLLRSIHDRMPVIVSPSDIDSWLWNGADQETYARLCSPFPEGEMETYPVSRLVNRPENDGKELIIRQ
ncbi:MAG TPA: SOS response-associated peptidase [Atribacteraceae bacterium]|nr:SOS response-associated peptidase [Atribacteraceae bacterium]